MSGQSRNEPFDILLVEDNPGDVRLTQEAFKEAEPTISLHVTMDGNEALEFLFQRGKYEGVTYPDLVLLDLNLPKKDGHEVLKEIRDEEELTPVPILVLTSSETEEDVRESYELTANAYLTKSADPDEFASLMQSVADFWLRSAQLPPVPA
ncbi:response regulator [Natrinema amylolyticum]|uniref:response regulator n=1 Tax=Natrinema amylolyticum TaxID=2878679 RepID=UPI001CFB4855|nr:response regulator [Natrinema amylolyticum]